MNLELGKTIKEICRKYKIPGCQTAFINKENKLSHYEYGHNFTRKKQPIIQDSLFRIASVTKVFTSSLILKLIENKIIEMDATIDIYIKNSPFNKKLTIKHLLNQTSGLGDYMQNHKVKMKSANSDKCWNSQELVDFASQEPSMNTIGNKFHYSNTNMVLLGYIASLICKKPIHHLMKDLILSPQNINATFFLPFDQCNALLMTGRDTTYHPIPFIAIKHKPNHKGWSSAFNASGGMASNATDMTMFIHALFHKGIIGDDLINKMTEFVNTPNNRDLIYQKGYGLGLQKIIIGNKEFWGHLGGFMGFSAFALYNKKDDVSFSFCCNNSRCDLSYVIKKLASIYL